MTEPVLLTADEINRIARYCSEEVMRQYYYQWEREAPLRVGGMIEAMLDANARQFKAEDMSPLMIARWGAMIEPRNTKGFRQIPIFVGANQKMDWRLIDHAIDNLCAAINEENLTALEAYREFEEIHPFEDGNGRTGKIILNWINGTLIEPVFPPSDFWGQETVNP